MDSPFSLQGKVAVVTGGFGLLGADLVPGLLQAGAKVWVLDVKEDPVKFSSLRERFEGITFCVCDITKGDSVKKAVERVAADRGGIDILVNNAYPRNVDYGRPFEEITLESWNDNVSQHLGGYFNVTQAVSRVMTTRRGGSIITIASIYGIVGPDFSIYEGTDHVKTPAEYSAIKGGLISFTRYLATYLSRYNIRANSVSPGGIFNQQDPRFVEKYEKKVPLGRMGRAEDVSGAVVFLASDASSYITGQNIAVDGGWTAW